MRLRTYGTVGLLVEVDSGREVDALCAAIEGAELQATARPGWRSVLVSSDLPPARLADAIHRLDLRIADRTPGRDHEVSVTFDGEDLDDVARVAGMATDEVVRSFTDATYAVRCLGFSRAFPYLEGLDPRLHVPRHDAPRTKVRAGSVAIAGDQTGIYPSTMPGGWHLLGRTSFVVFDETLDPPARLRPGDTIRFVAHPLR